MRWLAAYHYLVRACVLSLISVQKINESLTHFSHHSRSKRCQRYIRILQISPTVEHSCRRQSSVRLYCDFCDWCEYCDWPDDSRRKTILVITNGYSPSHSNSGHTHCVFWNCNTCDHFDQCYNCAYILKAGFAGFQNPQTIWNFPQKDCLRTRKLSVSVPES